MKNIIETMGRAQLEKTNFGLYAIFVKKHLEDDINQTPRPVKHVGSEKYIMNIWNGMKKSRNKYEADPKYLF